MTHLLNQVFLFTAALTVICASAPADAATEEQLSSPGKNACGSGVVIYNRYKNEIVACQCNHKLYFRSREVTLEMSQRLNPCFYANGKIPPAPTVEPTPAESSLQFTKEVKKQLQKYQELTFSFELDSAIPADQKEAKSQIRDLAKFMKQHPELKIRIVGVEGSTAQDIVSSSIMKLAEQPGIYKDEFFKLFNLYGGQANRQASTAVIGQLMAILEKGGTLAHEKERIHDLSLARAEYAAKQLILENMNAEQVLSTEAAVPGEHLKVKRKEHGETIGEIAQIHQWIADNERVVVLFYDLEGNPVRP